MRNDDRGKTAAWTSQAGAQLALRRPFHLACIRGPDRGAVFPVPGILGRKGAASLTDPSCSREHARIEVDGNRVVLEDLGSFNGTYIRRRLTRRRARPGTRIRLTVGTQVLLGANVCVLRARPRHLDTPSPLRLSSFLVAAPFMSMLFFLSLRVFSTALPTSLGRAPQLLIPLIMIITVAGIVLFLRLTASAAARDAPALALRLASLAAATHTRSVPSTHTRQASPQSPSPPRLAELSFFGRRAERVLLPSGVRPRSITPGALHEPKTIGCIGSGADGLAMWIASVLIVRNGGGRILLPDGTQLIFGTPDMRIHIVFADSPTSDEAALIGNEQDPYWRIAVAPHLDMLPSWCQSVIETHGRILGPSWWEQLGAHDLAGELPHDIALADLLAHYCPSGTTFSELTVPVGVGPHGPFLLDLVADGPHALLAGSTGSGKSEALLTWLRALCATRSPQEMRLILIDYKGGATFASLRTHPCVEAVFTDLSQGSTSRALRAIPALLRRRELEFAQRGYADYSSWVDAYREGRCEAPPPRIVLAIDEFAVLAQSHGSGIDVLSRIAAQGRSLGFHLIAATQRPSGALTASMRANLELRIGLRVLDESDSIDLLGDSSAAHLPRLPGRAIVCGHGTIHFARSSPLLLSSSTGRTPIHPLPWAPYAPTRPTWEQIETAPRITLGREEAGTAVLLALVDGIDEGTHAALEWHCGSIAVRAPLGQAPLVDTTVRTLAEQIGAKRGIGVHICGVEGEVSPDNAGDLAALFEEIPSNGPSVLVLSDMLRAKAGLAHDFGPLLAEEIWTRGLLSCAQAGTTLIFGAPGARLEDPELRRCALVFDRPDPIAPFDSGPSHGERPSEEDQWIVHGVSQTPRLSAIPAHPALSAPTFPALVRTWESLAHSGKDPQLRVGPRWTLMESDSSTPWYVLGDTQGHATRALKARVTREVDPPPSITVIPSESWTRLLAADNVNILALDTPDEYLRALSRSSLPPHASLLRRLRPRLTGILRIDGQWMRVGLTQPTP